VSVARALLVVTGVALMATGGWFLADNPDLPRVGLWFAAPVLVHDALLAPLGLAVGWLVARALPPVARGPVLAGLVVTLALTVLTLPLLLRPEPYPVTLLDRDYVTGYVTALGVTWAGVLLAVALRLAVRHRRPAAPTGARVRHAGGAPPADESRDHPSSVRSTDSGRDERGGP
jgi:hypothetical protein